MRHWLKPTTAALVLAFSAWLPLASSALADTLGISKSSPPNDTVQKPSDNIFSKDNHGVITDHKTGLQWFVGPDRDTNWTQAKKWVEGLSVVGGGWRMPTKDELHGLYQKGVGDRNIDSAFQTTGRCVWASETGKSSFTWPYCFAPDPSKRGYSEVRAFAARSRR